VANTLIDARKSEPNRLRLVFYLGDGETTAENPATTDFLAPKGLFDAGRVYGYGTATGGPMREQDYADYQGAFTGSGDGPPDPTAAPTQPPYVVDPSTGQPAISRIDEATLKSIASDLGVDYQHRDPGTTLQYPAVSSQLGKTVDVPNQTIEARLYWVPVIPAFLLLAWDLLIGWKAFGELRRARPRGGRA
jgi:Ca-activated chloride channel homolog